MIRPSRCVWRPYAVTRVERASSKVTLFKRIVTRCAFVSPGLRAEQSNHVRELDVVRVDAEPFVMRGSRQHEPDQGQDHDEEASHGFRPPAVGCWADGRCDAGSVVPPSR